MTYTMGSLFSGYEGLGQGVELALGPADLRWVSDIDPGAVKVLAHRYPTVPNLGDITGIDWEQVEPVDVLTGGFPCQDLSLAGARRGMRPGTRSGLWAHMAYAINQLRPSLVVIENVRGLLSAEAHSDLEPCPWCMGDGEDSTVLRALGAVLGDLADLGYDAQWRGIRAADVGAPHGRFRVFVTAYPTDVGHERGGATRRRRDGYTDHGDDAPDSQRGGRDGWAYDAVGWPIGRVAPAGCGGVAAADSDNQGREGSEPAGRRHVPDGRVAADTASVGSEERWTEPARIIGGPDAHISRHAPTDTDSTGEQTRIGRPWTWDTRRLQPVVSGGTDWGQYGPAIARWEAVTRPAPPPTILSTKGNPRLSGRFCEWLMGLPDGWVTDVPGVSNNDALKLCGNGVVPAQAAAAVAAMLSERVAA